MVYVCKYTCRDSIDGLEVEVEKSSQKIHHISCYLLYYTRHKINMKYGPYELSGRGYVGSRMSYKLSYIIFVLYLKYWME